MLEVNDLSVSYGSLPVLRRIRFKLERGQIGCLLGPSGSGKTTLLRAIAGFEPVQSGEIRVRGDRVAAPGFSVPPDLRAVGMVFQDYALMPHLTAAENIAFGLHRLPKSERAGRVSDLLSLVKLQTVAGRYPHELSGGMQQRVALARALAPAPAMILMDEPFANLDPGMREHLSIELRELLERAGATALIVTHTQQEAFALGDLLGVLVDGELRQWDTPYAVYHEPADGDVAGFIGEGAWLSGTVRDGTLRTVLGDLHPKRGVIDGEVRLLLRPDDLIHDDSSPSTARVIRRAFRGAEFLYTLQLANGEQVLSLVPSHHRHAVGEEIGVRLDIEHVICFPTA